MTEYDDTDFDDEIPWASPEIRERYEAALGRFMLAYNQLDHFLTGILCAVVREIGRNDLESKIKSADFQLKLLILDLLKASKEGKAIEAVSIKSAKEVSGLRGFLAHAHYDENPFDGSYTLINKEKKATHTAQQIDAITDKANKIYEELRLAEAHFIFRDVELP